MKTPEKKKRHMTNHFTVKHVSAHMYMDRLGSETGFACERGYIHVLFSRTFRFLSIFDKISKETLNAIKKI